MFWIPLCLAAIPAVHSIIVRDPPPVTHEYKYSYFIDDPTTGDLKSQHEVREGGVVSGAYTVLDPDGIKRTVEYTAHPKTGFKAIIRQEPIGLPSPVKFQVKDVNLPQQYYSNPTGLLTRARYTQVSAQAATQNAPLPLFTPGGLSRSEPAIPGAYFRPNKRQLYFPEK